VRTSVEYSEYYFLLVRVLPCIVVSTTVYYSVLYQVLMCNTADSSVSATY